MWNYYGGTGKGVGVAVVDTGIAGDLPDFRISSYDKSSRVIGSAVVHPDATTATDRYGHGTHVAGIIAGDSSSRSYGDPLKGKYSGVAPDANRVSIKASDDDGNSTVLDVIARIVGEDGSSANQGLTPNSFLDPAPGEIDYSRSSWSRSSWSDASDLLRSSWSRSSWSTSWSK
jgi:subtilisin family serine protease